MAQFPCMPLWTDAWVADTCHLSFAQRGAYMDLLILMWRTPGCRIPNDNGWLQSHLRCSKDELRDLVRPMVDEFCRIEGNFILQKRQQKELEQRIKFRERLMAGRKRAKNQQKNSSSSDA